MLPLSVSVNEPPGNAREGQETRHCHVQSGVTEAFRPIDAPPSMAVRFSSLYVAIASRHVTRHTCRAHRRRGHAATAPLAANTRASHPHRSRRSARAPHAPPARPQTLSHGPAAPQTGTGRATRPRNTTCRIFPLAHLACRAAASGHGMRVPHLPSGSQAQNRAEVRWPLGASQIGPPPLLVPGGALRRDRPPWRRQMCPPTAENHQ